MLTVCGGCFNAHNARLWLMDKTVECTLIFKYLAPRFKNARYNSPQSSLLGSMHSTRMLTACSIVRFKTILEEHYRSPMQSGI